MYKLSIMCPCSYVWTCYPPLKSTARAKAKKSLPTANMFAPHSSVGLFINSLFFEPFQQSLLDQDAVPTPHTRWSKRKADVQCGESLWGFDN